MPASRPPAPAPATNGTLVHPGWTNVPLVAAPEALEDC